MILSRIKEHILSNEELQLMYEALLPGDVEINELLIAIYKLGDSNGYNAGIETAQKSYYEAYDIGYAKGYDAAILDSSSLDWGELP